MLNALYLFSILLTYLLRSYCMSIKLLTFIILMSISISKKDDCKLIEVCLSANLYDIFVNWGLPYTK